MTIFEIIILMSLYVFAVQYMALAMGIKDSHDWVITLIITIASLVGVFCFPAIFAVDIWKKLNKEDKQ